MEHDRWRFLANGGLTLGLGETLTGNRRLLTSRAAAADVPLSDHERLLAALLR